MRKSLYILLLGMLFPIRSFSQPFLAPTISIFNREDIKLISTFDHDTVYTRAWDKRNTVLKSLDSSDFLITQGSDTATIIHFEKSSHLSTKELSLNFVLDNSASMFHAYDSLTTYLDQFLDSIGSGAVYSASAFDNLERKPTYDGTSRAALFLASLEPTEDKEKVKAFWHFFDTIRTDNTPLYEAIWKTYIHIRERRQSGDSLRTDVAIVLTDGEDNVSATGITRLRSLAEVMNVTLFVVNFRVQPDGRLMFLVRRTNGRAFSAGNLSELRNALTVLHSELSTGYKIIFRFPFLGAGSRR